MFAAIVALCFWLSAWLRSDELALDYSALAVELRPADSAVNGYSLIREFSDDYQDSLGESYDDVFLAERADWDLVRMKEMVYQRQKLLEAFEVGLRMELFKFDQPISPDTLIPEVGHFRRFVQTKLLQARIAELEGRPDDALQTLLELESNIEKYAGSGGGLINMLTAIACAQILNEAVEDLLAHANLEVQVLKAAQRDYDIGERLTSSAQIAFRYEFHFACNSIDIVLESPEQFTGDLSQGESLIAEWNNRKNRARMRYLFKVNRTKNNFFRVYEEIVRELPKPANKREFASFNQLAADASQESYERFLTRNMIGRLLTSILLPAIHRVIERVDVIQARCSVTRLTIGLKAYYIDHQELPDRLEDLVPDYVHAIPVDPFDGESLRYDKKQAILYSVGSDFVDNGGSDLPFAFELEEDDAGDEAENDETEPTFPLRFAM
jgi:hypothetical protein